MKYIKLLSIFVGGFAVVLGSAGILSASAQTFYTYPDTTPPWVTRWAVTDVTPFAATINWSTDEPADAMVEFCTSWVNCGNFTPLVPGYTHDHTINLMGLTPGTRYYFWMYSRDEAGNLRIYGYRTFNTDFGSTSPSPTPLPSPSPTPTPWPTPFPIQTPVPLPDSTPPWVTSWSVTNVTPFAATINWSTDEPADAMVEFCTSWVNCANFTPRLTDYTIDHTINLSNLTPYTRYYFWMYSRDEAGNLRVYGYKTFRTAWVPTYSPTPTPTPAPSPTPSPTPYPSQTPVPLPDTTTPWVMRWSVSNVTTNSAQIDWITDEPTDGKIEYCTSWNHCGTFTPLDTNYSTHHTVQLTGLNSYTRYYFWIYSADQAGNLREYGYRTFHTAWAQPTYSPTPLPTLLPTSSPTPTPYPSPTPYVAPDTTPPWVTRWAVTDVTPFAATINWSTDEPADAMVEFCTSWVNCGNFTPLVPGYTHDHTINLMGLTPGTRYYFWMYSRDEAGNLRIYGYRTFNTAWTL